MIDACNSSNKWSTVCIRDDGADMVAIHPSHGSISAGRPAGELSDKRPCRRKLESRVRFMPD